ncbi:polyketide synthase [Gloeophyllum trabeum ATCC 11539]|uniref:Polyketide synthase n=1 Tax=Gloeophyllum trabeum (strain ATCC 11539 / FP-39264 / Madison 617) TaxID=670483 RepID=S7PVK0_GLOTA|nr:polyketide synthase [Gloeophyllum trabeum ATCC 11539]EPQ51412.1 polyketide synthase [Gloeophyllum trabeum ATCC 11539]
MSGSPHEHVAVIGSSCRLPGNVTSPTQFWTSLLDGKWGECNRPPPPSRNFSGSSRNQYRGGWLGPEGVEDFDASFFNVTPGEATTMRPNSRLALELTWEALENAAIVPSTLKGKNVSVTIGMGNEDGWALRRFAEDGQKAFDHNWAQIFDPSAVAGRVAHFFDFRGATCTISSACASGMQALEYAIHTIIAQNAELAVVGGIATHFSESSFLWASSLKILSSTGRCSAFSPTADGYVPSEGAVLFILKRADIAMRDRDRIDGVIRGLALRNNGRTPSITSPDAVAQASLLREALDATNVSKEQVVFHEAHGTGTLLGDMIELEAIQDVHRSPRTEPLYLTTSKTVVGHCQAAAGLVGLLKALLCFKHRKIPPHHVQPFPDLNEGSVRVPISTVSLEVGRPLIATVSSFGFTGGITCAVIESGPITRAEESPAPLLDRHIFLFSGKTYEALLESVSDVTEYIRTCPSAVAEVATILCAGREHHSVRRAIIAADGDDLERCMAGEIPVSGSNNIRSSFQSLSSSELGLLPDGIGFMGCGRLDAQRLIADGLSIDALAKLFESDHSIDFRSLYDRSTISPGHLCRFPLYPFQRQFWWPTTHSSSTSRTFLEPLSPTDTPQALCNSSTSLDTPISIVANAVGAVLHLDPAALDTMANIFDLGINSINSIELAQLLSNAFSRHIAGEDLYNLLTLQSICDFLCGHSTTQPAYSQSSLESFVEEFSSPLSAFPSVSLPCPPGKRDACTIVLTGATGFLGSHIVEHLLVSRNSTVYCLIRGDSLLRLRSSFRSKCLNIDALNGAILSGRLRCISITDLADPGIGCTREEYEELLGSADVVLHCAWRVDFNLHFKAFQSDLRATRHLVQFCALSRKHVVLHFVTSCSTSSGYDGQMVPEAPLELRLDYCLPQGYAFSKLAAEHMLYRMHDPESFDLCIMRVGQICGDSSRGIWNDNEMIPMVLSSIPVLQAVPQELPDVTWVPVDICAAALCEIILDGELRSLDVYNITNPHATGWPQVVGYAAEALSCPAPPFLPFEEYIEVLRDQSSHKSPCVRDSILSISRLIPALSSRSICRPAFCSLDVARAVKASATLANCPPVDSGLVSLIIQHMKKNIPMAHPETTDGEIQKEVRSSASSGRVVFLFGPSSGAVKLSSENAKHRRIFERLMTHAMTACPCLPDLVRSNYAWSERYSSLLKAQLHTLAFQLYQVEDLAKRGIYPSIVLGYCFGEFAAAITSGAASEENITRTIVLRISAISGHSCVANDTRRQEPVNSGHPLAASCEGSMLNVFAPIDFIRRNLLHITPTPEIAIHGGPRHVVLTGSQAAISASDTYLKERNVACAIVDTTVPSHSRLMDGAIQLLRGALVDGSSGDSMLEDSPAKSRADQQCTYVSGLTGRTMPLELVGLNYWLRHMREPLRFFESMCTVRRICRQERGSVDESWTFLDLGPDCVLTNMVNRYEWDDVKVYKPGPYMNVDYRKTSAAGLEVPHARKGDRASGPTGETTFSSTEGYDEVTEVCLSIISSILQYSKHSYPTLLQESLQSMGLDSLGFVRLRTELKGKMGVTIRPSAYTSELTLRELLKRDGLVAAPEVVARPT